jgi:hypothetical protein
MYFMMCILLLQAQNTSKYTTLGPEAGAVAVKGLVVVVCPNVPVTSIIGFGSESGTYIPQYS